MYIATVGTAVVSCARFKTRFICISRTRTGRHRGVQMYERRLNRLKTIYPYTDIIIFLDGLAKSPNISSTIFEAVRLRRHTLFGIIFYYNLFRRTQK